MIKETAKQIEDRFSEMGFNIPNSEIESRLEKLLNEFKVPAEEARRSVVNYFLKEYNIPRGDFYTSQGNTPTVTVNTGSSATAFQHTYSRVGNIVTLAGTVGITTDGSGDVDFEIDLPVASNFANSEDANGSVGVRESTGGAEINQLGAGVFSDATNDTIVFQIKTDSNSTAIQVRFTAQYVIK